MRPQVSTVPLLRHHGPLSPWRITLLLVAVIALFGCGSTVTVVSQQGGGNTADATATATSAAQVSPTNTPAQAPQPTATKAPTPPNIAGSYGGAFTSYTKFGVLPMQIQVYQSGSSLSGSSTENEGTVVTTNSGTIALNGTFTITERVNGGAFGYLVGSKLGSGHIGGTWNLGGAAQGTWDVYNPHVLVKIAGSYSGSFTTDGFSGTSPMSLDLHQSGSALSGTTTEGSTQYTDTGTLAENGTLTINENGPVLHGGITDYGQLSGTWTAGSAHGTWVVNIVLI